jgi:amino acid adenylation domain-containing protein
LQFSIVDSGSGDIQLGIEYSSDLFKAETIAEMAGFYLDILQAIARGHLNNTDISLQQIQLGDLQQLAPANRETKNITILPFTPSCRDIYLASIAHSQSLENSTGYAIKLPMAIDEALWQQAIEQISASSSLLRASIISASASYQDAAYFAIDKKHKEQTANYRFYDVAKDNLDEQSVKDKLKALVNKPYDIHHDTLNSQYLVKVADDEYWAVFAAHHIIADGYACSIHLQQSLAQYEYLSGKRNEPISVEDGFAESIGQNLQAFDTAATLNYWQDKLQTVAGFSRQPQASHQTQNYDTDPAVVKTLPINNEHVTAIKQFCKQHSITPALYFKVILALLVKQYQRADSDFIIIESAAGRDKNNRNSIGCFYHSQPLWVENQALEKDINTLFNAFKQQQKQARNFNRISSLALNRLMPESQLAFAFNYLAIEHHYDFLGEKLAVTRFTPNARNTVDFRVQADSTAWQLSLAFDKTLFDDKRFLQRALSLSKQLLAGSDHSLTLDYRLDDEISEPVNKAENAELAALPLLPSLLQKQSFSTASKTAVICGDTALSYAELEVNSNALANLLIEQGLKPQSNIAICMSNRVELLTAIIASIKAGACYIPVDNNYPDDRIAFMLEDSQASVVISDNHSIARLKTIKPDANYCNLDQIDLNRVNQSRPLREVAGDDLLYMIYTSGSTGLPKAACVYHRNEANLLDWYIREYDFSNKDKTLIISAIGFDLTQKNLFALLCTGGTVVLNHVEHYDPKAIAEIIEQQGISYINSAPSAFYPLIELGHSAKLKSLRQVFFGGEPISIKRLAPWINSQGFDASIINMYGPTECTDIATAHKLEAKDLIAACDLDQSQGFEFPLGNASQGVELFVVNPEGQLLPPGFIGELCIAGASVGAGYWQRPELNTESFLENSDSQGKYQSTLYKTGDLVQYRFDNNNNLQLYYIGRKDFQVKLNGLRIELGEIEQALTQIPSVEESLVTVDNNELLAFVLSQQAEIPQWREHLQQQLPSYMLPKQLQLIKSWPLTANGKIDRKALLAMDRQSTSVSNQVLPRNHTEKELAALWQEVLGVGDVGIHDNFFTVGGDSLAAVRLMARIELRFEVKLPVASLFGAQTIAQLAHEIHQKTHHWSPIVPIQPQGNKTPIFAVHALGGMVLSYEPLARRLGSEQPFYGIQAYGFEEEQTAFTELNEMVEYYTLAILDVQSEGPFQLLGHSFGGVIAVEIARKLIERGHKVSYIGLIDSHMPIRYMSIPLDDAGILKTFAEHNFGAIDMPLKSLRLLPPEKMIKLIVDKFNGLVSERFLYSAIAIIRGFQRMMINFHNKPVAAPLYLYRPEQEQLTGFRKLKRMLQGDKAKTLGWHKVNKDITLYQSPGDHFSMLKDENVDQLAEQISSSLKQLPLLHDENNDA